MSRGEVRVALGERRLAEVAAAAERLEMSEQEFLRYAVDLALQRRIAASPPPESREIAAESPPDRHKETFKEGFLGGGEEAPKSTPSRRQGTPRTPRVSSPPEESEFDVFWEAYPRKEGRKAALKAWNAIRGRPPLADLLAAVAAQSAAKGWPSQYTPLPATWLNGERWKDRLLAPLQTGLAPPPRAWPAAGDAMRLECSCGESFTGSPHDADTAGWDWSENGAWCSRCAARKETG